MVAERFIKIFAPQHFYSPVVLMMAIEVMCFTIDQSLLHESRFFEREVFSCAVAVTPRQLRSDTFVTTFENGQPLQSWNNSSTISGFVGCEVRYSCRLN